MFCGVEKIENLGILGHKGWRSTTGQRNAFRKPNLAILRILNAWFLVPQYLSQRLK
jgi:hypothetical protein